MRSDGFTRIIDGNRYEEEAVFCDICGSGNYLKYVGIKKNNRTLDFCNNHKDVVIRKYLDNDLPKYSSKRKPLTDKQISEL